MSIINITQGKVAIVDAEDFEQINQWRWFANRKGKLWYVGRWVTIEGKKYQVYMHRFITNAPKGKVVDHINGNGLDNRRSNLRICTHRENLRNRGATSKNEYGNKCIYWDKSRNQWSVRVNVGGKLAYLGRFKDLAKAILVRDNFLKEFHGEFFRV